MQKVDGVQSVKVSLKDGLTILDLRQDNAVTLARLRQVIKDSGFVAKEAQVLARGQVIDYTYNSMGQITRETFADGTQLLYSYDADGNLTSASDGTSTTTLQYDPMTEDLVRVDYPGGRFLKFSYDDEGRRYPTIYVLQGLTGCDRFGNDGCWISAFDAATGKLAWKFNTIARSGASSRTK